MGYNAGTPAGMTRIKHGCYEVESWNDPATLYWVDVHNHYCGCQHFQSRLKGTGQDCKHLRQVRAAEWQRLLGIARQTPTDILERILTSGSDGYDSRGMVIAAIVEELSARAACA